MQWLRDKIRAQIPMLKKYPKREEKKPEIDEQTSSRIMRGKHRIFGGKTFNKKIRKAGPPSPGYENTEDEEIPGDNQSQETANQVKARLRIFLWKNFRILILL